MWSSCLFIEITMPSFNDDFLDGDVVIGIEQKSKTKYYK